MTEIKRLQPELALIVDKKIKAFAEHVLTQAPAYFWTAPSSSTGKYHPPQSNGEGGLVRHTKAVVYIAEKLCDVYRVTGMRRDCVVAACILHDVLKYGREKQTHTTKNHDYQGALFVHGLGVKFNVENEALSYITCCIAWHMGRWTDMTGRKVTKAFPDGYLVEELIVHLADVMAAQKNVSLSHVG